MVDTELIKFKGVKKRFGKKEVLDSIDLDIPENKITCIVGASGEGKTTILKLLIGFYKPTKGEVTYLRKNVFKEFRRIERDFGFASGDGSFYKKLTVRENLSYFGRLHHLKKKEIEKRIKGLVDFVGLSDALDTLAENLSIGMKKRLEIACSIIHAPKILIMDEPTSNLDPLLRKNILDLVKGIRDRGTTIIMTTQILNEVEEICDELAILVDKNIVEEGKVSKIKDKYGKENLNDLFEEIFSKEKKRDKNKSKKSKGKGNKKKRDKDA